MNNYFNKNSENSENNKKITKLSILLLVSFLIVGFGTYFITDRLINNKYNNKEESIEEKTVYNNTKALSDDVIIILMSDGVVEKEESIGEFKKNNSISSDISEQFIVNYYVASGYKLDTLEDSKVVFAKENTSLILEPNKYYIGEKDGYFAIYKSDENGRLSIESESDIYRNSRSISFLEGTEEYNDIKSFKYSYDTKEEAVKNLTAYLS